MTVAAWSALALLYLCGGVLAAIAYVWVHDRMSGDPPPAMGVLIWVPLGVAIAIAWGSAVAARASVSAERWIKRFRDERRGRVRRRARPDPWPPAPPPTPTPPIARPESYREDTRERCPTCGRVEEGRVSS